MKCEGVPGSLIESGVTVTELWKAVTAIPAFKPIPQR